MKGEGREYLPPGDQRKDEERDDRAWQPRESTAPRKLSKEEEDIVYRLTSVPPKFHPDFWKYIKRYVEIYESAGDQCCPSGTAGPIQFNYDWADYVTSIAGMSLWWRLNASDVTPSTTAGTAVQNDILLNALTYSWPSGDNDANLRVSGAGAVTSEIPSKNTTDDLPPFGPVDRLGYDFNHVTTSNSDNSIWYFEGGGYNSSAKSWGPVTTANSGSMSGYSNGNPNEFSAFAFVKLSSAMTAYSITASQLGVGIYGNYAAYSGGQGGWGYFFHAPTRRLQLWWTSSGGSSGGTLDCGSVPLDEWIALGLTWDQATLKSFVNGVVVASTAFTSHPEVTGGSVDGLTVGSLEGDFGVSSSERGMTGTIAEMICWHNCLTDTEMALVSNLVEAASASTTTATGGTLQGYWIGDNSIAPEKLMPGNPYSVLTSSVTGEPYWNTRNAVRASLTANQSIADVTSVKLIFNAESFDYTADYAGMHDNSTNPTRLTVPAGESGVYLIVGTAAFSANATGIRNLEILVDNATQAATFTSDNAGAGFATQIQTTAIYYLAAGSYVELRAYQNSGGALNVLSGANLSMAKIL